MYFFKSILVVTNSCNRQNYKFHCSKKYGGGSEPKRKYSTVRQFPTFKPILGHFMSFL